MCDLLSGAAFGLCNAYCEAMDCELLDDGDDTTFPNASEQACLQVKDSFIRITGEVMKRFWPSNPPMKKRCGCAVTLINTRCFL